MKIIDLSAYSDDNQILRKTLIHKLKELRALTPSGSTVISGDDLKTILSWINALEAFLPTREQNQMNLERMMCESNRIWNTYRKKK